MRDAISITDLRCMFAEAARRIRREQELLSQLDCIGGDGDHGAAMVRTMDMLESAMSGDCHETLKDEIVRRGSKAIVESAALLESAGIVVSTIRSTGGTGTYAVSGDYPGTTEIQAGSYLLMDNIYLSRGAKFQRSLSVLATVISTQGEGHAVLDCGVKAVSGERGLPVVKDMPGAQLTALHAEHALVEFDPRVSPELTPGQKVQVWVHYSDATVNLHSQMFGVRHGELEEIFKIEH